MQTKIYSRSILIGCFAVLTFAICGASAQAADTTWTNNGVNNWFTDGNWNNNHPDCTKAVHINNGGTAQINTSGGRALMVFLGENVGNSGTLSIDGTNGGSLNVSGCNGELGDHPDGAPPQPGDIYVGYHDRGTLIIKNGGTLTSGLGSIATFSNSLLSSNGAVSVDGANTTWTVNTWWLEVGDSCCSGPAGNGLLSITNGGTVTINSGFPNSVRPSLKVGTSSNVAGNGTIAMTSTSGLGRMVVNGTVAPAGSLSINGILNLNLTSATVCNVVQGTADMVHVFSGSVAIEDGARLIVNITGVPTQSQYQLVKAEDDIIVGTFQVTFNYDPKLGFTPSVTYDAHHVYLNIVFNH
jgi:T5SS/PEP-CTERM-associated repeat protein